MRRAVLVVGCGLALYGVVLGGGAWWANAGLGQGACPPQDSVVVVDTKSQTLCLCNRGQLQGRFRVALGRGGVGKQVEGDGKTPLGAYELGEPRPSSRFGIFVPVAYPTREQAKQGYTGADIGVHGPHRAAVWLGRASLFVNWTAGCIAVGTDHDIRAIAEWVRSAGVSRIMIV